MESKTDDENGRQKSRVVVSEEYMQLAKLDILKGTFSILLLQKNFNKSKLNSIYNRSSCSFRNFLFHAE